MLGRDNVYNELLHVGTDKRQPPQLDVIKYKFIRSAMVLTRDDIYNKNHICFVIVQECVHVHLCVRVYVRACVHVRVCVVGVGVAEEKYVSVSVRVCVRL